MSKFAGCTAGDIFVPVEVHWVVVLISLVFLAIQVEPRLDSSLCCPKTVVTA